jgi:hypothetical protein
MRGALVRLSVAAALLTPMSAMGVLAAPASAAGTACTGSTGSVTFSPGLTDASAKLQNIVIKGTLTGCTGSTVTSASYVAKLKSSKAATSSSLAVAGESASGSVVIKWSPKGQGNSTSSLTLTETGGTGATFGGLISSGPFSGLGISGAAEAFAPSFKGSGAPCSKKNPLKSATFTGAGITIS